MAFFSESDIADQIIQRAKDLGASLAGIASVELIKTSASHAIHAKIAPNTGIGSVAAGPQYEGGKIAWPEGARTALIIALQHSPDQPQLDWWDGTGGTPGNRILIGINAALTEWIGTEFSIRCHKMPYHIERGGIFLKDAAVLAGLGCIGLNNLLLTPQYGPRVRLRAMLLDKALPATGPTEFDPCRDCEMPCRRACPQSAFDTPLYSPQETGLEELPGRTGSYSRDRCQIQMKKDIEDDSAAASRCIRYCRRCELACPAGT